MPATLEAEMKEMAAHAAEVLQREFEGDPEGELFAWLRIAEQRESMVETAYAKKLLEARLDELQAEGLTDDGRAVLIGALGSVWAQEAAHARYLRHIIEVVDPPPSFLSAIKDRLNACLGKLQGWVITRATSLSWSERLVANLALAGGELMALVPDFENELNSRTFRSLCSLNEALEATAVSGYQRMMKLIEDVRRIRFDVQASTLAEDNGRTLSDERYHRMLFETLSRWPPGGPPPPPGPNSKGASEAAPTPTPSPGPTWAAASLLDAIGDAQARAYGNKNRFAVETPPLLEVTEALKTDGVIRALKARANGEANLATLGASNEGALAPSGETELTKEQKEELERVQQALKSKYTLSS